MPVNKAHLTNQLVDDLEPTGKDLKIWDDTCPGLHVRLSTRGSKSFAFWYRTADKQPRSITIGKTSGMKVEVARKLARQFQVQVDEGKDPSGARYDRISAPTMQTLWEEYLERHARPKKKPRSVEEDERLWRLHLATDLSATKVAMVTVAAVSRLHADLSGTPGAANRAIALLSKLMSFAEANEWRTGNPCKLVERYPEHQVERYLTLEETRRLTTALGDDEDQCTATIIRFLLLTGARRGAVMSARWADFKGLETDQPLWTIPAGEQKGERALRRDWRIKLSTEAASLLLSWKRSCPVPSLTVVFPSEKNPLMSRQCIKRTWNRVRTGAGLGDVRIHDLRHSFASFAINAGVPLAAIGASLGHKDLRTTQRYAHLSDDTIRDVADAVSHAIPTAWVNLLNSSKQAGNPVVGDVSANECTSIIARLYPKRLAS